VTLALTLLFWIALAAAILLALPHLSPAGYFFGVAVPLPFREREEARAALHHYYAYVLCGAGGVAGLTLALAGLGAAAPAWPIALLPLAAAIGFYSARRGVLPYKTALPVRDRLPWWVWLAVPPAAIPAAAMAYLHAHWNQIPLRFANHSGRGGHANGWSTRTPLHVYGMGIFGEGLVLLLLLLGFATYYGARKSPNRAGALAVMTIVAYPLALIFGSLSLMPVLHFPPWALAVALPPFVLGFLVWIVQKNAEPKAEGQADTPDECWRAGDIYVNPADPAIFVEKRNGFGFTFNLGNPWGVGILVLFFAGIGALVAFLIWSQR
jgi:multisubunit Na+/H+ antiporter MnhB subunit